MAHFRNALYLLLIIQLTCIAYGQNSISKTSANFFQVFNGYGVASYPDCVGPIVSQVYMSVDGCLPCAGPGCLAGCDQGSEVGCVRTSIPTALPNFIRAFFYTDDQCQNLSHVKPFGGYSPSAVFSLSGACVEYLDASIYQQDGKIVVQAWSHKNCNGSLVEQVTFPVGKCVHFPPSLNLGRETWAIGYLPSHSQSQPLSVGAIIGITVGVAVVVIAGIIFAIWMYQRSRKGEYEAIN